MKLVVVFGLLGIVRMSCSLSFPDSGKVSKPPNPDEGIAGAKDMADENNFSEDQFYQCFTDINCKLGPEIKAEMFECYHKITPEEEKEYTQWFLDSPKGNFTKLEKLNVENINAEICTLSDAEIREVNEHFAAKLSKQADTMCQSSKNLRKCKRMQEGTMCAEKLMKAKILSKECDTIVAESPEKPSF